MITPAGLRALAQLRDVTEALQFGEDEDALEALRPAWRALETAVAREGGDLLPMLAVSELLASPPGPIDWVGRAASPPATSYCVSATRGSESPWSRSPSHPRRQRGRRASRRACRVGGGWRPLHRPREHRRPGVRAPSRVRRRGVGRQRRLRDRPAGFNLGQPEWRARLAATIAARKPRIVVIDSMRCAAPGLDENDSTAVAEFMAPLRDLAAEHGPAIKIIHHRASRSPARRSTRSTPPEDPATSSPPSTGSSTSAVSATPASFDSSTPSPDAATSTNLPTTGSEPATRADPSFELVHVEAGNDDELYERGPPARRRSPRRLNRRRPKGRQGKSFGHLAAIERGRLRTKSSEARATPRRRVLVPE